MKKVKIILTFIAIALLVIIVKVGKDQWNENINSKATAATTVSQKLQNERDSKDTISFPQHFYVLQDDRYETSIYFRNVVKGESKNISIQSDLGKQDDDKWTLNVDKDLKTGSYPITIEVDDQQSEGTKSISSNIKVVSMDNKNKVNLLSIGDSMTRPNTYSKRVQEILTNVQTVGTRTYDNGVTNGEGRGGWTINDYMTKFGTEFGGDSPFLFPVGIEASHYLGNVSFWKDVCYDNKKGYEFEGFQKIASGWTGDNCLYDENGYPINPSKNDVVVDPNKPEGNRLLQYNGKKWRVMEEQPQYEFNFSKYMEKNKIAYTDQDPNVVTLLLGANDFQITSNIAEAPSFIRNVNTFIDSVKEYNSEIKLVVNLPIVGNTQEVWEEQGIKSTADQYRENMQMLGQELIDQFDGRELEGIYVSATNAVVGLENMQDWVHPNEKGYEQMGDSLAAIVQAIR